MRSLPDRTEVAIVGAGPTGLTLACMLAEEDIPFVLLDRLEAGANTSRAAVVHARTLEVLDRLDVGRRLLAEGIIVPTFTIRDRDRVLATVPFEWLPSRYPHTLMIQQQVTEAILTRRLEELGGHVDRPFRVTALRQDGAEATLNVKDANDTLHRISARYVVGADGMHSMIRERSGIEFHGAQYDESFVLADVRMRWPLPDTEVSLYFSPEGFVVVAPLPGGHHRIVATCDVAPETPDVSFMQTLLDARGPVNEPGRIHDIVWSSRFRLHHRVADRYRSGNVFIAGDAAHVHSPAGGQGMNTGIQDAVVLADTLIAVITGAADESRLDDYERIRRRVAKRVVGFTDRMTRVATLHTVRQRNMRNAVLSRVGSVPIVRRRMALALSGLQYR